MALTDKLTAIANAIRAKTGGTAAMTLAEMPTEIASIQTGITPSGTLPITENGTYDVTEYASANVNVSGGTEITDGIVVDERYSSGSFAGMAKSITVYGKHLYKSSVGAGVDRGYWTTYGRVTDITLVGTEMIDEGALSNMSLTSIDVPASVVSIGTNVFRNCSAELVTAIIRGNPQLASYVFYSIAALTTVVLGGVGYGWTSAKLGNGTFTNSNNLTNLTVYADGSNADAVLTKARSFAANATIIIKASEDTTYNGTAYNAGDTMITSTP